MKKSESKDVVIGNYPKAMCREIATPSGPYYMIYDTEPVAPNLLGYDIATSGEPASEENAWDMAAGLIGTKMIETLEK